MCEFEHFCLWICNKGCWCTLLTALQTRCFRLINIALKSGQSSDISGSSLPPVVHISKQNLTVKHNQGSTISFKTAWTVNRQTCICFPTHMTYILYIFSGHSDFLPDYTNWTQQLSLPPPPPPSPTHQIHQLTPTPPTRHCFSCPHTKKIFHFILLFIFISFLPNFIFYFLS